MGFSRTIAGRCLVSFALALVLPYSIASAEEVASHDLRADDAVQLFDAFCVQTLGSRDKALAVLANGNQMANRLPDELVKKAQGGQDGGVGWAIRSPRDAVLVLDYESRGICGVRIVDADEASVKSAFSAFAKSTASAAGAELSSQSPTVRDEGGARLTYQTYSYQITGRNALLALTTADKRSGAQQHFMTFGFVK